MNNKREIYGNPRIDGLNRRADAAAGRVRPDPAKIAWVGSMFVFGTIGSALTISPGAVGLFMISTAVSVCLGHSLGMHRRFIHRSFECPRWLEYLFVHFGVLVGLAGPLGMLRTHDTRDWAQRQTACHDYFSHAQSWYRDFWWQLFCSIELDRPPRIEIEPDIANDRVYRLMERTWMLQQLPWAVLFYALGGWGWIFWGICSRVTVSILGHWLIGHFAHNSGHRHWHVEGAAVQGYNVPFAALLTMGESWHNNHHAFPGSARLGLKHGEWDPGWWVLLGLRRLGLVSGLITPEKLEARRELRPVRAEEPRAGRHGPRRTFGWNGISMRVVARVDDPVLPTSRAAWRPAASDRRMPGVSVEQHLERADRHAPGGRELGHLGGHHRARRESAS